MCTALITRAGTVYTFTCVNVNKRVNVYKFQFTVKLIMFNPSFLTL